MAGSNPWNTPAILNVVFGTVLEIMTFSYDFPHLVSPPRGAYIGGILGEEEVVESLQGGGTPLSTQMKTLII